MDAIDLSLTELERRLRAIPDGSAGMLVTPRWLSMWNAIGTVGIILGLSPSLLIEFLPPRMWMAFMAQMGLVLMVVGYLPGFVRTVWVLAKSFASWRRDRRRGQVHFLQSLLAMVRRCWMGPWALTTRCDPLAHATRTMPSKQSGSGLPSRWKLQALQPLWNAAPMRGLTMAMRLDAMQDGAMRRLLTQRMRARFKRSWAWQAGALAAVWAMAGIASAATDAPGAQQQLRPLLDEMLAAANAHDTDRFMAAYARQPEPVLTFDDMTLRGWQVIRDQQLEWWDHGKSDAVYRALSPAQVTPISADVAATLQTLQVSSTTPMGAKATMRVVATSIWKKLPDGWRIVVAHESMVPEPAPAETAPEEPR